MARRGADIVLADINDRRLEETSATIATLGRRALAVHCDVARDADVEMDLDGPRASALSVLVFGGPVALGRLAAIEQVSPPAITKTMTVSAFALIFSVAASAPKILLGYPAARAPSVAVLAVFKKSRRFHCEVAFIVRALINQLKLRQHQYRPQQIGKSIARNQRADDLTRRRYLGGRRPAAQCSDVQLFDDSLGLRVA